MIQADLHLHTNCSHGANTAFEMFAAARQRGLALIGFSEHSPRPQGFNYRHEYREQLTRLFPEYISSVRELKKLAHTGTKVLLGLEMDWLDGETDFIAGACRAYEYDYIIGSVHFLDKWGFDDGCEPWEGASQEACERHYFRYFELWRDMLASGLFQIAAHPDLIKIFSADRFRRWIARPESQAIVRACLLTLRENGMAMEISSAGLRKPCSEIYPGPEIMRIAAEEGVAISMASDAHCVSDVGRDFDRLADYARSFGFERQTVFESGRILQMPF